MHSSQSPNASDAVASLLPGVYDELKALAGSYMRRGAGHTLQPTALVHEAYLKLQNAGSAPSSRDHLMATAAVAMRQVLVDHARDRGRLKRGGEARRVAVAIEELPSATGGPELPILELDELLLMLADMDPRGARVAEMRLFGGMTQDQIAGVLGVSRMTVVTDWRTARAWLASRIGDDG